MTPTEKQITQLYIGYFGRCPDRDGFNFWLGQANAGGAIFDIANSFAADREYMSVYGGLSNGALIDKIYMNLFRRMPDAPGKDYWLNELAHGLPVARLLLDVISGAQGADALKLNNAATVAYEWMRGQSSITPFDMARAKALIASLNNWGTLPGANVTITPELSAHAETLTQAIKAGWAQWGLTNVGIDIEVKYQPSGSVYNTGETRVLLQATPKMEVEVGGAFTESGVEYELKTGFDPNGLLPDLTVRVMTDIDWLLANYSGDVLAGLMAHECGHAFFREGWATSYSRLISFAGGAATFIGANAVAEYGQPVPLFAMNNYVHVAVPSSVMWPYASQYVAYRVTPLDKAMLRDMGILV